MSLWILLPAVALLGLAAPFLIFPEIVSASSRVETVTTLTLTVLAAASGLVLPWPRLRWAFWALAAAIAGTWWTAPVSDPAGVRHFAGLGLHLFTAVVCATWCHTERRLLLATSVLSVLATAVLIVGLLSTPIDTSKLGDPASPSSGEQQILNPQFRLDLPGMTTHGHVNANALAGTALLVLPVCVGLLVAGRRQPARSHWYVGIGAVASVVAAGTVVVSLSRMAWLAAVFTLVVGGLVRRSTRTVTTVVALGLVLAGVLAMHVQHSLPQTLNTAVASARDTATLRLSIWEDARDRIAESPWMGNGFAQFHKVPRTSERYGPTLVPHAHNIVLQWLLDTGVVGAVAAAALFGGVLVMAWRAARGGGVLGAIAAGGGMALVAVHAFGIGDAIAPGAKVGIIQWLWVGLVMAAARLSSGTPAPSHTASTTNGA